MVPETRIRGGLKPLECKVEAMTPEVFASRINDHILRHIRVVREGGLLTKTRFRVQGLARCCPKNCDDI